MSPIPWFKVDDTLAFHAKVVAAGNEAMGLWVRAGSWSSQQLTDGFIPDHMIAAMGAGADRLIEVGLWTREDGGCRFHEWEQAQFTRAEIEAKREAERDRKRKQRRTPGGQFKESERSPGGVPAGHPVGQDAESRRESHRPVPTRPDPTHPVGKEQARPSGPSVARFDEFWSIYPRKVGKQTAVGKYKAAVKRAGDEQTVIDGAQRLASDPNLPEKKYIPHPTTWLERDGWEDEPLPSPARPSARENTIDAWSTPAGQTPAMDFIDGEVVEFRRALP